MTKLWWMYRRRVVWPIYDLRRKLALWIWSGETGYMCKVDAEDELGYAAGGNSVYSSIKDLKANRPCVESCGIREVHVIMGKVIQRSNYGYRDEDD